MNLLQLLLAYGSLVLIVVLMTGILAFLLAYTSSWLFAATLAIFIYTLMDMIKNMKGKPKI